MPAVEQILLQRRENRMQARKPEPERVQQTQSLRRGKRVRRPSAEVRGAYVTLNHEHIDIHGYLLQLEQQKFLKKLYEEYENLQFTKGKSLDIPEWPCKIALKKEVTSWQGHYKPCERRHV